MNTFEIRHSLDSYEQGNGKVGDIHILLDSYAFPNDEWFDFGFYIISAWAESFIKLHNGEEKVQCKFMDGNYRFDILRECPKTWKFNFIAERQTDEIRKSGEVNANQATETLLESIDAIMNYHKKKGNLEKVDFWQTLTQKLIDVWKR